MKKYLLYGIIAVVAFVFVGWQIYHTFLKGFFSNLERAPGVRKEVASSGGNVGLVIGVREEKTAKEQVHKIEQPIMVLKKGGTVERNPFAPALPVEHKVEVKETKPLSERTKKLELKKTSKEKVKKEKEIVLPPLQVTGIIWGEAPARVIMEGGVYKIGDRVKGAEIVDISKDGVELDYMGKRFKVGISRGKTL